MLRLEEYFGEIFVCDLGSDGLKVRSWLFRMERMAAKYKRVLLKLSGETLLGEGEYGIDPQAAEMVAMEIKAVWKQGVEVAVVIGGGNIFRGLSASQHGIERATADYIGMLGTIMNALALQNALEKVAVDTRVLSSLSIQEVAEPYIRRRGIRHMEKKRVVILAGGTGNPYFTTDTAAALRALELGCDVLLKGTKVDGVYDKDPKKHDDAVKLAGVTFKEALMQELKVMDANAFALCMDNQLPIVVFDFFVKGNFEKVLRDEVGTRVG